MIHSNPLLKGKTSKKFITMGEIMLRLTPPNYDKTVSYTHLTLPTKA